MSAASDPMDPNAPIPTAEALQAAEMKERREGYWLAAPALALMSVVVLAPIGWLFWLSFIGEDGSFGFENYQKMFGELYLIAMQRTFEISFVVTGLSILLGYPLAYAMIRFSPRWTAILLACTLLPFWTSMLVRTYAWLLLLQRRGIINSWLLDADLIDRPLRLVHNVTGTVIGMTHIMVPFMVLPLYAAMKAIDRDLMKAASVNGATPLQSFLHVFLPLSLPGLMAGTVVVYVLCLGFYITPAVLGGGRVTMWAMQIETAVTLNATWGPAAALGITLLALSLGILWIMSKLFRIDKHLGRG